jgi:hypothetical protein
MVKYLSFHNSSFALRYFFYCKWQGHGVTHPLFWYGGGGRVRGGPPVPTYILKLVSFKELKKIIIQFFLNDKMSQKPYKLLLNT